MFKNSFLTQEIKKFLTQKKSPSQHKDLFLLNFKNLSPAFKQNSKME